MVGVDISVVLPVFDEEGNLAPLMAEIAVAMKSLGRDYEVVFVDDRSRDGSLAELDELKRSHLAVRVARHSTRCGQSAGLATGFRISSGRVIVTMDADRQNDPADIPRLVQALEGDVACVCGVRASRQDDLVKRFSSKVANGFRNIVTGDRIRDAGCSYRAIRRDAIAEVPVFNGMHRFLPTILRAQGYRVEEVMVGHRPRTVGQTKYGVGDRLWRGIRDCFAIRWYRTRAIKAARLTHE
jgi:glycosyltransferase involved in cell wall biosynthesis